MSSLDCFHTAILRFPVVIAGLRNTGFTADILDGASGFDRLQNDNDLVFGESGFTHGALLRGHSQYAGRSLKVNGPVCGDAYRGCDAVWQCQEFLRSSGSEARRRQKSADFSALDVSFDSRQSYAPLLCTYNINLHSPCACLCHMKATQ